MLAPKFDTKISSQRSSFSISSRTGVPNLYLTMSPFGILTDDHEPLKVKDEASAGPYQNWNMIGTHLINFCQMCYHEHSLTTSI